MEEVHEDKEQVAPEEAATSHEVGPSGQPAEGTVAPPADAVATPEDAEALGSIADDAEIPDSEEEVTQDDSPINPEEADEAAKED